MSEQSEHEDGLGKTGGLPGDNADPKASELTEDERDGMAATADVPRGTGVTLEDAAAAVREAREAS